MDEKEKKKPDLEDMLLYGGLLLCSLCSFLLGGRKQQKDLEETVEKEVKRQLNKPKEDEES